MDNEKLKEILIALHNSCIEGVTGEWDASGEGKDAFYPMAEMILEIADILHIDLPEERLKKETDL